MRGATLHSLNSLNLLQNFNPRTPCGVRLACRKTLDQGRLFQSTHPMRGATACRLGSNPSRRIFQSTHPMRGATFGRPVAFLDLGISIHAPHAGCDKGARYGASRASGISIHAPHAGCDYLASSIQTPTHVFQSTHPMRGATSIFIGPFFSTQYFNPRTPCGVRPPRASRSYNFWSYFNPRTPCGVRPHDVDDAGNRVIISIHAPHAGCDLSPRRRKRRPLRFQSTHPMRGATPVFLVSKPSQENFNPRTPCGVRRSY